ncbi:terpenoid synthase [Marasmius fiardii PR-910]|nr:terpenoid synthase [Marasmius fiardii PR-910]
MSESNMLSSTTKSFIKRTVHTLLEECNIPLDKLPFDQDLCDECKEYMAYQLHLPPHLFPWFGKYLNVGVMIVSTSYSHLLKLNRIHIAIYTAFAQAIALYDIFAQNPKHMEGFNERFVKGISEDDPILDGLSQILLDTSEYHDRAQSSLIVSSTLNFVASLIMDMANQKLTSTGSSSFSTFCWNMSDDISTAYATFIFPKEIELATYVGCLPHISTYINCMNDVLSFYKDEVVGEDRNFAIMLAKEHSITTYEAIQRIAGDVFEADKHIQRGLADNQLALDSWQSFKRGYVRFHTSCRLFKLDELFF